MSKLSEWISVKERLPEEFGQCLVYCQERSTYWETISCDGKRKVEESRESWWRYIDKSEFEPGEGFDHENVTHWMPLPEPPDDTKE